MIILGLDPGLRNTGFGVIHLSDDKKVKYLASGVIKTVTSESLPLRLKTILNGIASIIDEHKPHIASIEKVFVNVNPQSTLLLGQARGACISGVVLHNLPVYEYTALQVKQATVGYGHAQKEQVQKMVMYMLGLKSKPQADAADALACALSHIHYQRLGAIFSMTSVKNGRIRS